ncbi:MAG: flavin reductase family protein [Opitutaceae bacterium]|jgi:flavin reductase (DIM6/NTAB) family NADH-FMN oxidoreductase RutF|nr:flavin reductase family protein [Opitutaceae bacterium]
MQLDLSALSARDAYGWLSGLITPRPIAWVSTLDAEGRSNLAPFSFFNGVTSAPPTLLFIPVNLRDGAKKDTVLNLEAVPECVVHIVPHALAAQMNACAARLPRGESEFAAFGIEAAPSVKVRPPRVAAAPAAFECRVRQIVPVGEGPMAAHVVICDILWLHVRDEVLGPDGAVDAARLDTVGRLGGEDYATTRDRFTLERPDRRR